MTKQTRYTDDNMSHGEPVTKFDVSSFCRFRYVILLVGIDIYTVQRCGSVVRRMNEVAQR